MLLFLGAVCALVLYLRGSRYTIEDWTKHYRVGWRPAWLPASYPEGRFVDWSDASPSLWVDEIERPVHLVAAMMGLRAQLRTLYGGLLAEQLDQVPVMVQAAAVTYHGLRILASPITPERAFEWALLLHFEEGVAESRSAVVSSLVQQHAALFDVPLPPIVAPFLTMASRTVKTTVSLLPDALRPPPPRQETTDGGVHQKTH